MRHFLLFILLGLISFQSHGQELACGTKLSQQAQAYFEQTREARKFQSSARQLQTTNNCEENYPRFAVQFYIFCHSPSCSNTISASNILSKTIALLNDRFKPYGVDFFSAERFIDHIYDPRYKTKITSYDVSDVVSAYKRQGFINIYIAGGLDSGLAGFTYYPPSEDGIFLHKFYYDKETVPHEMGHFFSLRHTHGSNSQLTKELVTRVEGLRNCEYEADDLCDTPADPNLQGKVSSQCIYQDPGLVDANGDKYLPSTKNIMSYSRYRCRDQFTAGQGDFIFYSAQHDEGRTNLASHYPFGWSFCKAKGINATGLPAAQSVVVNVNTTDENRYRDSYGGTNNQPGDDVFFKLTLTEDARLQVKTCDSTITTYLHLMNDQGTTLESHASGPLCGPYNASISRVLSAGDYVVAVEGKDGQEGDITIEFNAEPRGKSHDLPIELGELHFGNDIQQTHTNNDLYGDTYSGPGNQASNDIFYRFSLSEAVDIQISLCKSSLANTYLHLLDSTGKRIHFNNDYGPVCSNYRSSLQQHLSAGTYFIVVEGIGQSTGEITTAISVGPGGATLGRPIHAGTLYPGVQFNHYFFNSQEKWGDAYKGPNNQPSNDIFYAFTLPSQGDINISLCGSPLDDTYTHLLNAQGELIVSNDDKGPACNNKRSSITQSLPAGDYYVVSEANGNITGTIDTRISY